MLDKEQIILKLLKKSKLIEDKDIEIEEAEFIEEKSLEDFYSLKGEPVFNQSKNAFYKYHNNKWHKFLLQFKDSDINYEKKYKNIETWLHKFRDYSVSNIESLRKEIEQLKKNQEEALAIINRNITLRFALLEKQMSKLKNEDSKVINLEKKNV